MSAASARRGPKRPRTIDDAEVSELLEAATVAGREAELARQAMLAASSRRRDAVQTLYRSGLSIRQIAELLDVSHTVVANIVRPRPTHSNREDQG